VFRLDSSALWDMDGVLIVGKQYHGALEVMEGGFLTTRNCGVGGLAGSNGRILMDGSETQLTCLETLSVGGAGTALLDMQNGASVAMLDCLVAELAGGIGQITIDGAETDLTCSGTMHVGGRPDGPGGAGELAVGGGATANVAGLLKVWPDGVMNVGPGSAGAVRLAGGGLVFTDSQARLFVADTLGFGPGCTLASVPGATIHMTGSALENECTDPADMAGLSKVTVVFEGGEDVVDDVEVAGRDLGAVPAGWTDNFALGGLILGGAEPGRIRLVDEFDNQPGWVEALYVDALVMNAGAKISTGGLNLYYLNGGSPKRFIVGDATLDGSVDVADLGAVATYYGQCGQTWVRGDFNGDHCVDVADLGALATTYGMGSGAEIPEPAALALMAVGALALIGRRMRKGLGSVAVEE